MKIVVIISVLSFSILLQKVIYAQTPSVISGNNPPDNAENNSSIKLQKQNKTLLTESKELNPSETANIQLRDNAYAMMHIKQKEPSPPATIISSFKSNIHFAGFWNHYAIINFTPDVFVKAFDFISIYASHNTSV